jgi:hypothetical protein
MPTCKSWIKYSWEDAYCKESPWEPDPEGLCILHSLKPDKDKDLFDQALKEKLAREDFDFKEIRFPHPVSFAKQKFTKPANFQGAKFVGWADFREAEFTETADFSFARFAQAALFEKARFSQQVHFQGTTLDEEADFRGVTFEGLASFEQVNERGEKEGAPPFTASCQFFSFGFWGRVRFRNLSLARVSFLGTDMRRLEFHNVRWHLHRGRQIVYDEALLEEKEKSPFRTLASWTDPKLAYEDLCARVEELYRYLKLNYEGEGDQKQAGDFHYGEMEMHRRANIWRRRFPFSWYNLYWALSGYGERPFRAIVWLLGLLGGMAFLLASLGLNLEDGARAGFGSALIYLLQQATLIRPDWAAAQTTGGHLLEALGRILLPAQTALFILALRNRLGRRR